MTHMLPVLTVNRSFMAEFIAAYTPCFALGMVEEQQQHGFLALRPDTPIPPHISDLGFNFGHSLLGNAHFEVIQFVFAFYGFQTYHALLNPNNPLVQQVLAQMIESGDYFFFALNPDNRVTAFRSEIGDETLSELKANLTRIQHSTTNDSQYEQAVVHFAKHPDPKGIVLNWVCRDSLDYLDLSTDRMTMNPASPETRRHVSLSDQQIQLATAIDDHVHRILAGGGGDEALLRSLYVHMNSFKQLMDLSSQEEIDTLSARYDGFFRYAKLLEALAGGLADGSITVPD